MRGEVGKDTPKKEMDFYDVTHDTLSFLAFCHIFTMAIRLGGCPVGLEHPGIAVKLQQNTKKHPLRGIVMKDYTRINLYESHMFKNAGGRGHRVVYYTSSESFIETLFYLLA